MTHENRRQEVWELSILRSRHIVPCLFLRGSPNSVSFLGWGWGLVILLEILPSVSGLSSPPVNHCVWFWFPPSHGRGWSPAGCWDVRGSTVNSAEGGWLAHTAFCTIPVEWLSALWATVPMKLPGRWRCPSSALSYIEVIGHMWPPNPGSMANTLRDWISHFIYLFKC